MKFAAATYLAIIVGCTNAFVAPTKSAFGVSSKNGALNMGLISEELDLPPASPKTYPNLPESVHPGVLSGQAMMDLLADAKEKGEYFKPSEKTRSRQEFSHSFFPIR